MRLSNINTTAILCDWKTEHKNNNYFEVLKIKKVNASYWKYKITYNKYTCDYKIETIHSENITFYNIKDLEHYMFLKL